MAAPTAPHRLEVRSLRLGSIDIATGTVVIDARTNYLHVVHPGTLSSEGEVMRYAVALEREANHHGLRRALVDARHEINGGEPPAVRLALWRWLQATEAFEAVALIMPDALAETRVNMLAVSQRMLLRAFVDPAIALRWLTRAARSTSSFKALDETGRPRRASSFPPSNDGESTFGTPPAGSAPRQDADPFGDRRATSPGLSSLPPRKITRP